MNTKKILNEDEIKKIAIDYANKNKPKCINIEFAGIIFSDSGIYPEWSVIFEMRDEKGEYIDGPIVFDINEYGEMIFPRLKV